MLNSSHNEDILNNPKLQLINYLVRQCYYTKINASKVLPDNTLYKDEGLWCPRTFDGFACWSETPASATAVQHCPEFVVGFDPKRFAYKRCTEDGTWFMHPDANKPWTNYTTCIDIEDLEELSKDVISVVRQFRWFLHLVRHIKVHRRCKYEFRNVVNNIYIVGYSISAVTLLLSMMIFLYFRSLQCTRIRIHMHLFTSFALNNILWIIWYMTVVNKVIVVQENKAWCQILHVFNNYFMVTSYFWMFCEGLHLHIALVVVFVKDDVAMRWFVTLGWGAPLAVVTAYAAVRYYTPTATERCWMDQSDTFWIINVPVLISLIASFAFELNHDLQRLATDSDAVFLVNVVRVLLTKLHPAPNNHASMAARKAARAALILVPLFGLHYILIPLRPAPDTPGERVYQVISALLTSLQGVCVSVLFCFTNHDVMLAARAQAARILRANDAIAMTGITAGESLVNTRENIV